MTLMLTLSCQYAEIIQYHGNKNTVTHKNVVINECRLYLVEYQ